MKPGFPHISTPVLRTFHFKLLSISATVLLAVAAVVVSVHSSGAPATTAEKSVAKSGENPRGKLKTSNTAAIRRLIGLAPLAPLAPTVTATKADTLFTDIDGDLQADPGDTLKYTVNIGALGEDATGVTFTDTVDPNTMFVGGTLTATPVAVDDSYTATGNIRISVAAPGVLGNDFTGVPAATITAPPSTSANGGDVTLNADGSFTYNPPAGFEGTDTFSYTLTNASGSNNATVTVTVSGMIWFIDNNAAACTTLAAGCGRLTNPFSSLSAFAALNNGTGNNPAANDNIFVYESATDYVGPVTLLSGQRFIGQDATASLSAITGLTPPSGSDPLPATNSANGTIVNITGGNAITVDTGNTLRGFTGGDSTTDITGIGFGTLTISDVTLNGIGQALNLNTGTLAATFGSISSTNSATTGISLTSVAGSLTSPTTTITNPAGIGLSVGTSSATLNFGTTASTSSGGTGVSLLTNSGTITFGTLTITPDASQRGLLATDNTNTLTSTGGAISASGAIAVEITRVSSTTPLAISQTSVSASGGANGIKLTNVSGSFTVTGDSGGSNNGSGGTISGVTAEGVIINTASNISLGYMNVTNSGTDGIHATGVNGFTLNRSNVSDSAGITQQDGVEFDNVSGTVTISNSTISGSPHDNIDFDNNNTNLAAFNVTGSTIQNTLAGTGANGIVFIARGTSVITAATLTGNIISGNQQTGIQPVAQDTANIQNFIIGQPGAGNGNTINANNAGVDANQSQTANITFRVVNNTLNNQRSQAINAFTASGSTGGTMTGFIQSNIIGTTGVFDSGSVFGSGIRVVSNGGCVGSYTIDSNQVREVPNARGIEVTALRTAGGQGGATVKVTNNTVTRPTGSNQAICGPVEPCPLASVWVAADNATAIGNETVCSLITGNTAYDPTSWTNGGEAAYYLQENSFTGPATHNTEGTNPDPFVQIANTNTVTNFTFSDIVIDGAVAVVPPGSCGSFPSAAQSIGEEQNAAQTLGGAVQEGAAAQTDDILWASAIEKPGEQPVAKLNQAAPSWIVQAALARWEASGIPAEDLARLRAVTFEVVDLPAGQLATANSTSVKIDETAAGFGWYFDGSPMDDSEFDVQVPDRELQTTDSSPAIGRMDLLTVVMRELGVAYGSGKDRLPRQLQPLMQNTLSPAVRRLPDSRNIKLPSSTGKVSGLKQSGSVTSPVSEISKRRAKSVVSTTPSSLRNATFNPGAKQASGSNSRLTHHAPRNMTAPVPSMLADVLLNIGTLPAGESVTITFNVTVDDSFGGALPQVSNQGTVSGSNFADVLTDDPTVGGAADPTVTPIDLPDVSVAVSPASVAEDGATNLVYTFTRNGSTANALTVNFSIGGTANFGASPDDYTQTGAATFTPPSGTVTFGAGNSTATVTVNPETDTTVEPDETVVLTVTSGTGYDVGAPSSASGTITNDDADVSVAVSPASVAEDGATNLVYTFTRAGATANALTVNFSVGGTANFGASPNDYTQTGAATYTTTSGTVTFGAGNSTATVTVNPETDTTIEADETVILTLTAGAGYNVSSPSSATGTITNDDADVSVAVSPASVAEDGATNLVYTFTRTGFTGGALTVNFSVGGTATFGVSPNDYTQTGATTYTTTTGSVTFAPASPTATVTVNPETDTTAEADETVIITLTAGASYNVVSPSSATGTILNDDTLVSVVVSPSSTAEGGANLVYTFTRTGPTGSALTVNFSVGGSASFPADYSQGGAATFTPPTATVTFGVGSSTKTVTVTPLTDCTVEGSEAVVFTVQPGTGYGVGSPSSATGTINNTPDSSAPTITLIPNVNMTLWPPNHQYESIAVTDFVASASDNCDASVNLNSVYILKITSDEAENGNGDGNTLNDIVIGGAGCKTAQLRSERDGSGDGRVYTITFKVKDSAGNFATATTTVTVRKSPNKPAVDSGVHYTVNSVCP